MSHKRIKRQKAIRDLKRASSPEARRAFEESMRAFGYLSFSAAKELFDPADYEAMVAQFQKQFGREPGRPGDPYIWDLDSDVPKPLPEDAMRANLAEVAAKSGMRPEIIYAMRKTGLFVTEESSPESKAVFKAAIQEYFEKLGGTTH